MGVFPSRLCLGGRGGHSTRARVPKTRPPEWGGLSCLLFCSDVCVPPRVFRRSSTPCCARASTTRASASRCVLWLCQHCREPPPAPPLPPSYNAVAAQCEPKCEPTLRALRSYGGFVIVCIDQPRLRVQVAKYNIAMAKWWMQDETDWRNIVAGTANSSKHGGPQVPLGLVWPGVGTKDGVSLCFGTRIH